MTTPDRVHLDHAATTTVRPTALAALAEAAALPGNPASLHASGRRAKLRLEEARERIAAALGAHPTEVILTSGGTEADNLAVQGLYRARRAAAPERTRIVLTGLEHHAVLDVVDWLAAHEGAEPVFVPVDDDGRVDLAAWEAALAAAAFYPESGGQNGDWGEWHWQGGVARVVGTRKDKATGTIWHRLEGDLPAVGA